MDDLKSKQFTKLSFRDTLNQPNSGSGWSLLQLMNWFYNLKHNSLYDKPYIELSELIRIRKF